MQLEGGDGVTTELASVTTRVSRFYIYFSTLPTADCILFYSGTGTQGVYFKASDSSIYAGNSSAGFQFGATGVAVTTGQWYLIDVITRGSSPRVTSVSVNGTECGDSTHAGGASATTTLVCYMSADGVAYYDDLITSHNGADYPIGPGFVNHFVPVSDGTHNVAGSNDFERGTTGVDIVNATTDAYTLVDDVPLPSGTPDDDSIGIIAPPNSTDYVELLCGPAPGIATPTTGPRLTEWITTHHEGGTGTPDCSVVIRKAGTASVIEIFRISSAGATSYRYARTPASAEPGGVPWTAASFLAVLVRITYCSDANPDVFIDAVMIEAEFAPTTNIKTLQGVTWPTNVKTLNGLVVASVKTIQGTA